MPVPPGQRVLRRHQVDRAPHEVGPHRPALDEQFRQHGRVEAAQPRPEPGEGLLRFLGLQAAQVRDRVEDRDVRAFEEELEGERRAAEGTRAEPNLHGLILAAEEAGFRPLSGPHRSRPPR